jgi:hypothetical protein
MPTIRLAVFVFLALLLASLAALTPASSTTAKVQQEQGFVPTASLASQDRTGPAGRHWQPSADVAPAAGQFPTTPHTVPLMGENIPGAGQ